MSNSPLQSTPSNYGQWRQRWWSNWLTFTDGDPIDWPLFPQKVGIHINPQLVGIHINPQKVGIHINPQKVGIHINPLKVGVHINPQMVGIRINPHLVGIHIKPQKVDIHIKPQKVGFNLNWKLLEFYKTLSIFMKSKHLCYKLAPASGPGRWWEGCQLNNWGPPSQLSEGYNSWGAD